MQLMLYVVRLCVLKTFSFIKTTARHNKNHIRSVGLIFYCIMNEVFVWLGVGPIKTISGAVGYNSIMSNLPLIVFHTYLTFFNLLNTYINIQNQYRFCIWEFFYCFLLLFQYTNDFLWKIIWISKYYVWSCINWKTMGKSKERKSNSTYTSITVNTI